MPKKKIDIFILALLGFLSLGLILSALPPVRSWTIPNVPRLFVFLKVYLFFQLLGVFNILLGLGILRIRDITLKELGTLTWMLEIGVAGFVFVSVFFIRLDWGILPFYAGLRHVFISLRILLPVVIFLTGALFLFRRSKKRFGARELAILVGLSFLFNLAIVAVNPSFVTEMTRTFNRRSVEYYGDVPKVDRDFLSNYVDKMPTLSLHGKTHPPLATLFLWALTHMGVGIFGASAITTFFGSLTLLFVYGITYDLFGDETARIAAGVFCLVPAVVLYSAVSVDALFMFLCAATIFFFQRSLYNFRYAPLLALFFSLALFSTFVSGFLLLTFAIWVGLSRFQGSLPKTACRNLAWGGGLTVIIYLALYWGLNYNILEVFFRAQDLNSAIMSSGSRPRPYSYWVAGNLVDYFTFLGFPLFAVVCLYAWKIKKKVLLRISRFWPFCSQSCFLTSPA